MPVSRNCQYCATRFTTNTERRVFCSDRCKTRYHRENSLTCFYCGEMATSKDHMLPQVYGDGSGDTVPACRECNSTLSCIAPESIEERFKHLYRKYVSKYKLDKPIPEWDDDELEELGHSLRSAVQKKIRTRQRAVERVLYIKARFRVVRGR